MTERLSKFVAIETIWGEEAEMTRSQLEQLSLLDELDAALQPRGQTIPDSALPEPLRISWEDVKIDLDYGPKQAED